MRCRQPPYSGHYCVSCARPLRRGQYGLCILGCGQRLCRTGSCEKRHVPRNCPVWQERSGLLDAA